MMTKTKQQLEDLNILLTGSTGYIGGRLLDKLCSTGCKVRCLTRNPAVLKNKVNSNIEVVKADVLKYKTLPDALKNIDIAYYLIHSMASKANSFIEKDRIAAENFSKAAYKSGVKKIIYLGGLGDESDSLSHHLKSRHDVGKIFSKSGIVTIEFRASIILGSGSLSFEMIRSLVEKLPIMITPKWVSVKAQPISIEDVINYLFQALYLDTDKNKLFEIGGTDQVSYGDIMKIYARVRGIKIFMIPVPFLTPYLSSLWLGLVTPLYARIGRKLIHGITNTTVVTNDEAIKLFKIKPMGTENAIRRAINNEDKKFATTRWSDAVSSSGYDEPKFHSNFGSRVIYTKAISVNVSKNIAFKPIEKIGGSTGWYGYELLWKARGFIDLLIGGVGLKRGRSNQEFLRIGDAVDFWRVEKFIPDTLLCLKAEMKLPGRAWLEFDVISINKNKSKIRVTAIFDPLRILGRLYWYGLYPSHYFIFRSMLKNIVKEINKTLH